MSVAPTVVRWTVAPGCLGDDHELLSEPERDRLRSMRDDAVRHRFVTGRLLLRVAIAEVTGHPAGDVEIRQRCTRCGGPHGRVQVTVDTGRVEVSLSRAGELAVVAVGSRPVGVDVEAVVGPRGPTLDRDALRTWVRTEAVLKATGHGLDVDPSLVILGPPTSPPRLLEWKGPGRRPRMRLADLDLGPGYVAALARSGGRRLTLDVREVQLSPGRAAVPSGATSPGAAPAAPPPQHPQPRWPSPRSRGS
jgi:4'-phosphopantetheinyl transferase